MTSWWSPLQKVGRVHGLKARACFDEVATATTPSAQVCRRNEPQTRNAMAAARARDLDHAEAFKGGMTVKEINAAFGERAATAAS